jgi:magnesium chelatase family protein
MALAILFTRARVGVQAPLVSVETHLSGGLPSFNIVGLPEAAVKESRDRVRSAIVNSQFEFPASRITVNLAPADLPKEGGGFDLPIALGILAASGQLSADRLHEWEFIGELALSGELRNVPGCLPAALAAQREQRYLITSQDSAADAAQVPSVCVYGAENLLSVCAHLNGQYPLECASPNISATKTVVPDLIDVIGQDSAKRALEIAAAGGHHILFSGPPGTGKTLLASRLPGLLPPLDENDMLDVASLYSISNQPYVIGQRPYRYPHHTASAAALVGGGSSPKPGEISLAHGGVLFLDELPEFPRRVLEVLREPLEAGHIAISRARQQIVFPARFQLVAAMNPCPCGYFGDSTRQCRCTPDRIRQYRERISGPLLDRIDLQVTVPRLPPGIIGKEKSGRESTQQVAERVLLAREKQQQRNGCCNAQLEGAALREHCQLVREDQEFLEQTATRLGLSQRAYFRLLKVARTIADLADCDVIERSHLAEAMHYRALDKMA